jgi:hypothetical protein
VEPVRQLHTIEIDLETLGHRRRRCADARERRAIGRIVDQQAPARPSLSDDPPTTTEQSVALTLCGSECLRRPQSAPDAVKGSIA